MNLIFSPANPYLTIFLLKEPWLHFRHYPAPIMAFFFFSSRQYVNKSTESHVINIQMRVQIPIINKDVSLVITEILTLPEGRPNS